MEEYVSQRGDDYRWIRPDHAELSSCDVWSGVIETRDFSEVQPCKLFSPLDKCHGGVGYHVSVFGRRAAILRSNDKSPWEQCLWQPDTFENKQDCKEHCHMVGYPILIHGSKKPSHCRM
jgi:hypothetical protein